jgi:glyceraldehyde-3-phosphate dehydrogenase (NAD(P))
VIGVAVLGMGVIGKRVAHAVRAQPDMRLAGVVLRSPAAAALAVPGLPVFGCDAAAALGLRRAGLSCHGELADALAACDVLVDCGPAGSGATRHAGYTRAGARVVYCGGERSRELGPLVHPRLNPLALVTGTTHRAPSCNTTAVARVLAAVGPDRVTGLELVVLKCCTDNDKANKGVTNGARLSGRPTHHAGDLRELCPDLRVASAAATLPMICGHVIHVRLDTGGTVPAAELAARLRGDPRIALHEEPDDLDTAALKDALWRRPWHNRYELVVRPLSAEDGRTQELWLALDNEAVTVPELIDIVRCSGTGGYEPPEARTNAALGIDTARQADHGVTVGTRSGGGPTA